MAAYPLLLRATETGMHGITYVRLYRMMQGVLQEHVFILNKAL